MTILLSMMQRHGKFLLPEDVANAVLTQGADETRAELVRLMAEAWMAPIRNEDPSPREWCELAWTLEETARTAKNQR